MNDTEENTEYPNLPLVLRMKYASDMVYGWIHIYPSLTKLKEYSAYQYHEQKMILERITGTFTEQSIIEYCNACATYLAAIFKLKLNPYLKTEGIEEHPTNQYIKAENDTDEIL